MFSRKERKKREGPIQKLKNTIGLYDDLLYTLLVGNSSRYCRYIPREQGKIGLDFLGTYDDENVNFYYIIRQLPQDLLIDWKDRLRSECRNGVRLTFVETIERHSIDWESPQMKSRLRIYRQLREDTENKDIDAYNMHNAIKDLARQRWIEGSLLYLADADKQRGRALLRTSTLVIISGKKGEDFDDSVKLIEEHSKHIGITLERILFEIEDLISSYLPFSRKFNRDMGDRVTKRVLTDEIYARFSVYNQGTLGNKGTYFGTDIYSKFPVLKEVKPKDDTAENWLITAETGGGKSFFVKTLLIQLLAQGYNGTIMDIEGLEYIPMANYISHNSKVEIINMGEGNGKYFDPMEIAEETGIEEIDRDSKNMSVNFTTSIFKVLLGKAYQEDIWMDTVINDAVTEVYRNYGVTDNRKTWHLSKGLSLFDVYEVMRNLERFRDDDNYMSAVKQAVAITSKFFEEDGTRSALFSEKLKVSDIIDADLVICSFGMAGKSTQAVDEVQMALMQLGAAQLSHQRSIFSKAQGKFNFKVWEEFQRWGKFPDSDKTIGVALTGGRKLGDVNIIITNKLSELLNEDLFGVFDNITSFLVGAIGDEKVRNNFCNRLSIPLMKPEMDLLATAQKNNDENKYGESIYQYAFLCGLDRSKYGLVKMLLPHEVGSSKIFKTGVDISSKEE